MGWISDEESRRKFMNATPKIVADPMNVNLTLFKNEGFTFPILVGETRTFNFRRDERLLLSQLSQGLLSQSEVRR